MIAAGGDATAVGQRLATHPATVQEEIRAFRAAHPGADVEVVRRPVEGREADQGAKGSGAAGLPGTAQDPRAAYARTADTSGTADAARAAGDAGFALGTLFGSALDSFDALGPFAAAATGVPTRWIAQAEAGGPTGADARARVLAVLERADRLAGTGRLTGLLAGDRSLPCGYRTRLRAPAATLDGRPGAAEDPGRYPGHLSESFRRRPHAHAARRCGRRTKTPPAPPPECGLNTN